MTGTSRDLVQAYRLALKAWLEDGGEEALTGAYLIGRDSVSEGLGITDLTDIHLEAALDVLPSAMKAEGCLPASQRADRFLVEVLAPFEMALRGFQEANQSLQDLNETLERRVAERTRALAEAEDRYRSLVERIPAIVYTLRLRPDPAVTYVSPQVEPVTGIPPASWTRRRWLAQVHPDDRGELERAWAAAGRNGGRLHLEYRLVAPDGRVLWIRDEAQRVGPAGQAEVVIQGIATDITERRALEAQFHQAQKMETIGRLAGGVAHDFNNVLSVIQAYSELAQARVGQSHRAYGDLTQIVKASERGARLTRRLLSFSRREIIEPVDIIINDVVTDMRKMLERLVGEDVNVRLRLSEELPRVRVDPGQLEQVLLNLAVNARDAMPQGGHLLIETTPARLGRADLGSNEECEPGNFVALVVSDTGQGMLPEVLERIFEPFFTTKSPGKGTGLGLATVFGIVRQNRGHVAVESAPGQGSCFRVYLPALLRARAPVAPDEAPPAPLAPETGDHCVLVVEDEDAMREAVVRILNAAGYRVISATTGEEAIALVARQGDEIDLLLSDVVLPGVNGRAVAEALRDRGSTAPVVYMSGYTDDQIVRHGVYHNEAGFLGKPFGPRQLLDKVAEALAVSD